MNKEQQLQQELDAANKVISALANLATRIINEKIKSNRLNAAYEIIHGRKDKCIFEHGDIVPTASEYKQRLEEAMSRRNELIEVIDRLKTDLGVANSRLEAAREEGEKRRVEVAELKCVLAATRKVVNELREEVARLSYAMNDRTLKIETLRRRLIERCNHADTTVGTITALQWVIRDLRGL